jgi:hypothetical protein
LGERTAVIRHVTVEDLAGGDSPGDKKLGSEVDQRVGPSSPGPDEHHDGGGGNG